MTTAGMTWRIFHVTTLPFHFEVTLIAHLFSQFWFTLLDGCDEHVTDSSSWQTVQATTNAHDGNDVQVLTT
jgi:hypothetical protein